MNFNFPKETLIEKEKRKVFISYWLKRIFIEDWLIKITALGISVALWLGVTGLQTPSTRRLGDVPLNPLYSSKLEITNSYTKEVNLWVTGEKRKIDQLIPSDLVVSLDLSDVGEGDRSIQLSPQNVNVDLPKGVRIDRITPDKILIKLEKVAEHDVAIKVETTGNLAPGYEIYSTKITPEKVRVRGPKSSVESLNFVSTEKISLENQKANFSSPQTSLNIINPKVTPLDTVSANVFFRIGKKRIERLFVVPYETETRRGRASVLLYGPANVLEQLATEDLQIIEERTEKESVRLVVILPEDLKGEVEIKSVKYRE